MAKGFIWTRTFRCSTTKREQEEIKASFQLQRENLLNQEEHQKLRRLFLVNLSTNDSPLLCNLTYMYIYIYIYIYIRRNMLNVVKVASEVVKRLLSHKTFCILYIYIWLQVLVYRRKFHTAGAALIRLLFCIAATHKYRGVNSFEAYVGLQVPSVFAFLRLSEYVVSDGKV